VVRAAGADAILVGESLIKSDNRETLIEELSNIDDPRNGLSVKTDIAVAPWFMYEVANPSTSRFSSKTPFDGEALFISAIKCSLSFRNAW